jgi:hypothetical protein
VSNLLQLRRHSDPRVPVYRTIGQWIDANAAPDATVGALEVGIIGYYARRPMVDFAGLIQPEVAGRLTSGRTYEDAALWAVDRYRPDYLVLHDESFPQLEQGYAAQTCRIVQRFPRQPEGYSVDLTIFACR